ncbi:MAG: ATP-binding protein [Deltaproteobacteria bacterium]|nr:ATP-binding protein [Deltaproteobacteria bacterium]
MKPPETTQLDLSLESLRAQQPEQYRRWVVVGVVCAFIGYFASALATLFQFGFAEMARTTDPYATVVHVIALGILYKLDKPVLAAVVTLAGTWMDLHVSLYFSGLFSTSILVLPILIMAIGLFLGGRVATRVALLTALTFPAFMAAGQFQGMHQTLSDKNAINTLVAGEAVLIATAALLSVFLKAFARSLKDLKNALSRTADLQSQLQHAQKMEALGLLAGGIAHDFNNLLTAVAGYGSLISMSRDPDTRDLGSEIIAVQERGSALVRQLLAFARQEITRPRPIDIASTTMEMATLVNRLLGERITLSLNVGKVCPILADPGQIEQVILNLAANARDAMPEGGTFTVSCETDDHQVTLSIADNGVGMDEATQKRIFEPFFTTKERGRGTGLGLSTVHGIVGASNGTITVTSTVGEGSRFEIVWPRTEEPIGQLTPAPTASPVMGHGRNIIVVEDNDSARAVVRRILAQAGFTVTVARDGEEALSLIRKVSGQPDLFLTDVVMPGMTGPQLLRKVRERWPNLRFLFMSGYLGDIAQEHEFDPTTDLITKPFTPELLLERIESRMRAA